MKILIKVFPGSRRQRVEKAKSDVLNVYLKKPAKEGKANEELIKVLAKHFGVSSSCVSIVVGKSIKRKLVNVETD